MKYEKPTLDFISRLRYGESINLFDRKTKLFHHIQINRKEKRVCWERYVSSDKKNWIKWNVCLSIKDILSLRAEIAVHCQEMCFKKEIA